jgi:uncharacterized repeat protein (TIGR03803 family)
MFYLRIPLFVVLLVGCVFLPLDSACAASSASASVNMSGSNKVLSIVYRPEDGPLAGARTVTVNIRPAGGGSVQSFAMSGGPNEFSVNYTVPLTATNVAYTFSSGAITDDTGGATWSLSTAVLSTLVHFNGANGNSSSHSSSSSGGKLVEWSDGNFYGVTSFGGTLTSGSGTVGRGVFFRVTTNGEYTVLFDFNSTVDYNSLVLDVAPSDVPYIVGTPLALSSARDGHFYSIVRGQFPTGWYLCRLDVGGQAVVIRKLTGLGEARWSTPVQARDGNFYALFQPQSGNTSLVRITTAGVLSSVAEFDQSGPQMNQYSGVIEGKDSYIYGVLGLDGNSSQLGGVLGGALFKASLAGDISIMRNFTYDSAEGYGPSGSLVESDDGFFYGVAFGRSSIAASGSTSGVFYRFDSPANYTTLAHFDLNPDMQDAHLAPGGGFFVTYPTGLIQAKDGNFYGTTEYGGKHNDGTIFRVTPQGVLTKLVDFHGSNGSGPSGPPIQASDGHLYGVTTRGGANDVGTIYKLVLPPLPVPPQPPPNPPPPVRPDRTKPTVQITSRKSAQSADYLLRATLKDNVTVARVQYSLRRPGEKRFSRWFSSSFSGKLKERKWSKPIKLNKLGVWRIKVRAYDGAKNVSIEKELRVNRTKRP